MAGDPQLEQVANGWINWHRTQAVTARRHLKLRPASGAFTPDKFRKSADLVLGLIEEARQQGALLRPSGSNWSFSKVSAQQDCWILDTTPANTKARLGRGVLDPGFTGDPAHLLLAQCGTSIHELNKFLERERGLALATTGASNGQTIVGAMSTGTHGSAIRHGAVQSQIVAIQLLTTDHRNLWIERPARPVVAESFVASMGAQLRRDEALFDAALVSLGLLGVVHSVVIETRPRFLLNASQFEHPYDDRLRRAMRSLSRADLNALAIPAGVRPPGVADPDPYFFQLVVNPFDLAMPARVKLMYDVGWKADHVIDYRQQGRWGVAYDVPGFVGGLLDTLDPLTGLVVGQIFRQELKLFTGKEGTTGEMFNFTTPRSKTAGASLAVAAADSDRALDVAIKAHRDAGPAPLAFACRFVKKTRGFLSFTRFDPTCIIDMDGLVSDNSFRVMEAVRRALDDAGIVYTQHWGKFHDYRDGRLARGYGPDLGRFIAVRDALLPNAADRATFAFDVSETVIGGL